ncbi:MAG: glycosyltransferase family 4 protein [Spongiibacteraceae bacterium]
MNARVLNIGQNYRMTGGSDRYMFQLEALLSGAGIDVIPFAAAHPDNAPTEWNRHFPPTVNFNAPSSRDLARYIYNGAARQHLDELLHDHNISLAHLHIYYGQLSGSILKPLRDRGIPIIQTLHEYKLICPTYSLFADGKVCEDCGSGQFYRAIAKRCNRGSLARSSLSAIEAYVSRLLGAESAVDHFVAVSDFLRDKIIEHGIAPEKITTVHNFIDATQIEPSHQRGDYVLYLGRLERIKGIATLLDAIEPLTDVPLVIAGDGNDRDLVRAAEARLGKTRVDWRGFVGGRELGELIRNARFLVAPSEWYETFGLILIEAFAHGRTVISSRMGGMTEVVDDGIDGLLFEAGNVDALRSAILDLWTAPATTIAMGAAGREKVLARFSPQAHLQQILGVYHKVGMAA